MLETAHVYANVPSHVVKLLNEHLPYSLPLLRRLQFTEFENGLRPTARVVLVTDSTVEDMTQAEKFTVAYIDVAGGPLTQMWLYSTVEDTDDADLEYYERQLNRLVQEAVALNKENPGQLAFDGSVLLGSVHDTSRNLLAKTGRIVARETGAYDKWLFRHEKVPQEEKPLPEGMQWGTASLDDCKIVVARTDIPRTVETLSKLPSLTIKLDDGTPISWAFLGYDGSLISLHCEEAYRRKGLAKTLAAKLIREKALDFADDGWCSADVAPDNHGSRGMCKSLNGRPYWRTSWVLLDVTEEGKEKDKDVSVAGFEKSLSECRK